MIMIVLKNYPPLPIHSLLTCRLTFTCSLVNCLILHPLTAHGHLLFASIFSFPPINPPIASSFARHPAHRVVIFRRCLSTLYLYLIFPQSIRPTPPHLSFPYRAPISLLIRLLIFSLSSALPPPIFSSSTAHPSVYPPPTFSSSSPIPSIPLPIPSIPLPILLILRPSILNAQGRLCVLPI